MNADIKRAVRAAAIVTLWAAGGAYCLWRAYRALRDAEAREDTDAAGESDDILAEYSAKPLAAPAVRQDGNERGHVDDSAIGPEPSSVVPIAGRRK